MLLSYVKHRRKSHRSGVLEAGESDVLSNFFKYLEQEQHWYANRFSYCMSYDLQCRHTNRLFIFVVNVFISSIDTRQRKPLNNLALKTLVFKNFLFFFTVQTASFFGKGIRCICRWRRSLLQLCRKTTQSCRRVAALLSHSCCYSVWYAAVL